MGYSDGIEGDHADDGIEMGTASRKVALDDYNDLDVFDDEDGEVMIPVPLAQRQNRCFLRAIGVIMLVAAVVAIGMLYFYQPEPVQRESYNGVLSKEFTSDKQAEQHSSVTRDYSKNHSISQQPNGHGILNKHHGMIHHNDIHKQNQANADGKHKAHLHRPGYVDGAGGVATPSTQPSQCDTSSHTEWLAARVTLEDGMMYEVEEKFGHDRKAFVIDVCPRCLVGKHWLVREVVLRILDPKTMKVVKSVSMPKELFGEGIAYLDGLLYQITWKSHRGFVYNATTLEVVDEFQFRSTKNEGWGITWDPCNEEFVVTDGSPNLHFWNRQTLAPTRTVPVMRMDGTPADELNEIEWYRGRILANVWFEDVLLVIDPATGTVEKEYDFRQLFPKAERHDLGCDVFNGISVSEDEDVLYVTGKNWDRLFKVRLLV